jgi:hypothetical protein
MRPLLALVLAGCAAARPPAPPSAPDALAELNRLSRAAYADARRRAIAAAGPVLIVGPARITLLDGATRQNWELAPARYQDLKAIAHLALGLHALLTGQQVDGERRGELEALRAAAQRAGAALEGRGLSPAQVERQQRILDASTALIDDVLRRDSVDALPAHERAVAPLLLDDALDAARDEIADLDAAVTEARARLGDAGFARLHVVIVGAHMAREGEISLQYFEKLLGEREGLRIVFAEGLWDEEAELQLLGTHLLDASVGEGFFGDARRMHRDLLSDAAARILAGQR